MKHASQLTGAMPAQRPWTVKTPQTLRPQPKTINVVTRRYEIHWLNAAGEDETRSPVAPAVPMFEQAFSAFAQGSLVQTDHGYVAVEDLRPGDRIATADNGLQTLQWLGSMTLFPQNSAFGLPEANLYRISDGSYGLDRSGPDLLLGPAARILPGLFAIDSTSHLNDIDDMADGSSVIRIRPVSPVRVFHLALKRHSLVRVNGVLAESYHPGDDAHVHLSREMFAIFLSLFPHVELPEDFGPVNHPRLA